MGKSRRCVPAKMLGRENLAVASVIFALDDGGVELAPVESVPAGLPCCRAA
jgi:hypothetical protein